MQNAGGCFPPPPGYFERLREICDTYDVLLVSDEVICAYGRLGTMFGAAEVRLPARHHHHRQGPHLRVFAARRRASSRDRIYEPFGKGDVTFRTATPSAGTRSPARWRWPTWTCSRRRTCWATCCATRTPSASTLERLLDLPIVGDVRGDGYFYGIELVKDKATKETFSADESERVLRGFLSHALFEAGLYCRADDRGDPVVQVAPPLICGQAEFDEIESILRSVLTEAWKLHLTPPPRRAATACPRAPRRPASPALIMNVARVATRRRHARYSRSDRHDQPDYGRTRGGGRC